MIPSRDILICGVILAAGLNGGRGVLGEDVPATTEGAARFLSTARAEEVRAQYWFGVAVENLPPTIAKQLKLKADQGLMVVAVLPSSPAEKAGLKAEDLLIELDGNALTSQEDLARAANTPRTYTLNNDTQVQTPMIKRSSVTYLREGDRKTVNITPAVRPENMVVVGNSVNAFMLQNGRVIRMAPEAGQQAGGNASKGNANAEEEVRNIVLPDGTTAQVGPGYQFELSGSDVTTQTVRSIKQIVGKGQTVVLSQETDGKGNYKNTIVVGGKSYAVERGTMDAIPVEVRPLALQLLVSTPAGQGEANVPGAAGAGGVVPVVPAGELERRVDELEKRNRDLQGQLKELIDLLKKEKQAGG